MTSTWVPPRPTYHLRIFVICLVVVVICLVAFLFGVHLEAVAPATGVLHSRRQEEVRSQLAGLVELGWFEAEITTSSGKKTARLDRLGNGFTDPAQGAVARIYEYRLPDGYSLAPELIGYHQLQEGDVLWPGQMLGYIHNDTLQGQLLQLQTREHRVPTQENPGRELRAQIKHLQESLSKATVYAPDGANFWQVWKVHASSMEAVQPGTPLVLLGPIDPVTLDPKGLVIEMEVLEKHAGFVQPGQTVRLFSNMYNQRLYGHGSGVVAKISPMAEVGQNGERSFRLLANLVETPFPLKLGSTFKAEIVVGRKPVYNIILEH